MRPGRALQHDHLMSFDIFLQAFAGGAAAAGHPDEAFRALEPYLDGSPADGFARLITADGEAGVFGIGTTGLMINHTSGESIWQLLVDVAAAGDYAIMPVGSPVCLVREDMKDHLPEALRADAVLVRSGADMMKVVVSA